MKKTSYLLLPIAAFALAASSAYAFNPEFLQKAGLTEDQIAAFEEAHELKKKGDKEAARDVLVEAGVDLDTLEEMRNVFHKERALGREALESAIRTGDYDTFVSLEHKGPFASISTKTEFEKLAEAHAMREAGDHDGAHELMSELGIKRPGYGHGPQHKAQHGS